MQVAPALPRGIRRQPPARRLTWATRWTQPARNLFPKDFDGQGLSLPNLCPPESSREGARHSAAAWRSDRSCATSACCAPVRRRTSVNPAWIQGGARIQGDQKIASCSAL